MALSAEESGRLARLLTAHAERLIQRWAEAVGVSLRGRLSQAELVRQVQELHRTMIDAAANGLTDLASEPGGELRTSLRRVRWRTALTSRSPARWRAWWTCWAS